MSIPEFVTGEKTKDQVIAELNIQGSINSIRKKIILIIIGSAFISYSCRAGAYGTKDWVAANVLYLLGAISGFAFLYYSIYIFTDFRNHSRNALSDWRYFLENEEEFWEFHKQVKKIL